MKAGHSGRLALPEDPDARRVAMLVTITCSAFALGALALVIIWIVSGDLDVYPAFGWLLAGAENAGWIAVSYPADISHLTFDAPAMTVVFLLCAVIAGYGAVVPQESHSVKKRTNREDL